MFILRQPPVVEWWRYCHSRCNRLCLHNFWYDKILHWQEPLHDPCRHEAMFQNWASISLMVATSAQFWHSHYNDDIMGMVVSQITSLAIVYSTVASDADQRKHQSSASLAFVRGIHQGPVNSPHKWPVTRKMFPFDDVIIYSKFTDCLTTKMVENKSDINIY